MKLVVDASVAVKWFVRAGEPDWDAAEALLTGGHTLIGPELAVVEVANTMWKLRRRGSIPAEGAEAAVANVGRYYHCLYGLPALLPGAWALSAAHDHPLYDCLYLALAHVENAVVVTVDARLLDLARKAGLADRARPLSGFAAGR